MISYSTFFTTTALHCALDNVTTECLLYHIKKASSSFLVQPLKGVERPGRNGEGEIVFSLHRLSRSLEG